MSYYKQLHTLVIMSIVSGWFTSMLFSAVPLDPLEETKHELLKSLVKVVLRIVHGNILPRC